VTQRRNQKPCGFAQLDPRLVPAVDVFEVPAGFLEVFLERDITQLPKLCDPRSPLRRNALADILQDPFRRHVIQRHVTAGGKVRETVSDLLLEVPPAAAEQRAEATVISEFLSVMTDEVQDCAVGFAMTIAQTTPELLQEQRWAVRWAQENEGVHFGQIDTLVEEVDREEHVDLSISQVAKGLLALGGRCVRPYGHGFHAVVGKYSSHEARMVNAYAKAKSAYGAHGVDVLIHFMEDHPSPRVVRCEETGQLVHVISPAPNKRHTSQVQAVGDAVVREWAQTVLVDRVPQPKLGSDATVEPVEHVLTVGALWRGCESEQLRGANMIEQPAIGGGFSVMELVHDHHVEVAGW